MNARRLGCLSGSGLIAAALALLVVGVGVALNGGRWFSPGGLKAGTGDSVLGGVTSHAQLVERCSACHTPFWAPQTMDGQCLGCHDDIQAELKDPSSLHGGLGIKMDVLTCRTCHTEHLGADGNITKVGVDFPHEVTGFWLTVHRQNEETGRDFACQDCHENGLNHFDVQACGDCHSRLDLPFMQQHELDFGLGCLACHDGVDRYAAFDHQQTDFPLLGGHQSVGCGDCHNAVTTMDELASTPMTCFACHAQDDAHNGQFGADCAACHTPQGWKPASFDHNATDFPLIGAHAGLQCASCHLDGQYSDMPTTCFACHAQDDAHNGQFGTDCAACHTSQGWKPASFDHNATGFPLTGAHVGIACLDCHAPGTFAGVGTACVSCHAEPIYHQGLFGVDCAQCHTTTAWQPATFNGPHTFPMAHGGAQTCNACHTGGLSTYTCYGCHDASEMRREHEKEGIGDLSNCAGCHPNGEEDDD